VLRDNSNPTPTIAMPPVLLRPADAARVMGISVRMLWSIVARGELRAVRLGKQCTRFRPITLRLWAKQKEKAAGAEAAATNGTNLHES